MSETAEDLARLNIREQIARIDRSLDEAAKFRSERAKLDAKTVKLVRDRGLALLALAVTALGAGAAIFGAGAAFWKVLGG